MKSVSLSSTCKFWILGIGAIIDGESKNGIISTEILTESPCPEGFVVS